MFSFLGTLKCRDKYRIISQKRKQAEGHTALFKDMKTSIFEYIEGFYNSKRPHGSIGNLTPNAMEQAYAQR